MTEQEFRRQYVMSAIADFDGDIRKLAIAIGVDERAARNWVAGRNSPSPSAIRCIQLLQELKSLGVEIPQALI